MPIENWQLEVGYCKFKRERKANNEPQNIEFRISKFRKARRGNFGVRH